MSEFDGPEHILVLASALIESHDNHIICDLLLTLNPVVCWLLAGDVEGGSSLEDYSLTASVNDAAEMLTRVTGQDWRQDNVVVGVQIALHNVVHVHILQDCTADPVWLIDEIVATILTDINEHVVQTFARGCAHCALNGKFRCATKDFGYIIRDAAWDVEFSVEVCTTRFVDTA